MPDLSATETVGPPPTTQGTVATPHEALLADEVVRMRKFIGVLLVGCFVQLVCLFWFTGDPLIKLILYLSMAVTTAALGIFYVYIADGSRYSHQKGIFIAIPTAVTALVITAFCGMYSPAALLFMLGISFFSPGSSRMAAFVVYWGCALLIGMSMVLTTLGFLPDRGIIRTAGIPVQDQLLIAFGVQVLLFFTFISGRMARKSTLAAVQQLEQAVRQVGQREALIQEANQLLDRALHAGKGRYSGQQIACWKLDKLLGRGAMGEVYEAQHVEKSSRAAVKVLYPEVQCEPDRIRRLLREAEIMSKFNLPNVVRVFNVGDGSEGPPFIAMERLEGVDLHTRLRRERRLIPREVVELVNQVAVVLEDARKADIVHRDIKPQNIFFCGAHGSRPWKVLDFGISKIGDQAATLTGRIIGTPGYIAPEQATGTTVDHRADVFSLGAVAYRALTGSPAFSGKDQVQAIFSTVYRHPLRPSDLAKLHEDVDWVLALALAKDRDDRLVSAVELALGLEQAVAGELSPDMRLRGKDLVDRNPWGFSMAVPPGPDKPALGPDGTVKLARPADAAKS